MGAVDRRLLPAHHAIAAKMLLSKTPLAADAELAKQLKISREDVRLLKLYNMLPVT